MPETELAVAAALWTRGGNETEELSFEELSSLANTAGVEVLAEFTQNRSLPDSRYFFGPGKVEEIAAYVSANQVDTVLVDTELSPSQVNNLEKIIPAKIIDRSELILDIFARRATTREGKLQVELAQLKYQLPKLMGQGRDLSRLAGGIGTRGPGETKLEVDRRRIRRRISMLEQELKKLSRQRDVLRQRREKQGIFQVALVGYTNSGKSTLLNRLTDAGTYTANTLFATLDPLSRRLESDEGPLIVSDTVGFISGLPHHLIAAFRATLEVVVHADLLVHVVDMAQPQVDLRLAEVQRVLAELGCADKEQIIAANKVDLLADTDSLDSMLRHSASWVGISALTGHNLPCLLAAITDRMEPRINFRASLPMDLFRKLSRRHPGRIHPLAFDGDRVRVEASLPDHLAATLDKFREIE